MISSATLAALRSKQEVVANNKQEAESSSDEEEADAAENFVKTAFKHPTWKVIENTDNLLLQVNSENEEEDEEEEEFNRRTPRMLESIAGNSGRGPEEEQKEPRFVLEEQDE